MEPTQEKFRLLRLLDESRADILAALDGLAEDRIVYAESGWTVRDVIGHLSMWEKHAATSLLAFADGGTFMLNYKNEGEFNEQERIKYRKLSYAAVCEEWIAHRERLKQTLVSFPIELFSEIMIYPWQLSGTVSFLIEEMATHEREHIEALRR